MIARKIGPEDLCIKDEVIVIWYDGGFVHNIITDLKDVYKSSTYQIGREISIANHNWRYICNSDYILLIHRD